MGLSFRRSIKFGPLRVNLSGSGVSLSAGVRGAHVNWGPRGTYVSVGRGGFRYRVKLHEAAGQTPGPRPEAAPAATHQTTAEPGAIQTASIAELREAAPDQVFDDLLKRTRRIDWFTPYVLVACIPLLASLVIYQSPIITGVVFVALVALAFPVHRWSSERRVARLIYDVDDQACMERFACATAAAQTLSRCSRLWRVTSEVSTTDRKHNAGATALVGRMEVRCAPGAIVGFESNLELWSLTGPQNLLFLPDRLVVRSGQSAATVPYENLTASCQRVSFVEEGPPPPDAPVLGTTWRYTNKKGGPDLRFNDNRELPRLQYGELQITSTTGVRIVLEASNPGAAEAAAHALNELSRRCIAAAA